MRISNYKSSTTKKIKYVLKIHILILLYSVEMYQSSLVLVRACISHLISSGIDSMTCMVALSEAITIS